MIEFLKISNLALMRGAQVEFDEGFTAVTGETGAGKSVLLGALSLLAGNRCGKEIICADADTCRVEALISFKNTAEIDEFLEANGLPKCDEGALLLARAISREKSGRVFVNGALAPLGVMSELGSHWIDFHGPGEPQKLFSSKNQLTLLDNYCADSVVKGKYIALYRELLSARKDVETLKNSKCLTPDEIDFLKTQIEKIDRINPSGESVAKLESDSRTAEMSSEIVEKSNAVCALLNGEESSAANAIAQAARLASDLREAGETAEQLADRIEQAGVEIADIADEYGRLARSADMDDQQIADVRRRMSDWLSLSRKYGATPEIVRIARDDMARKIEMQSDVKASLKKAQETVAKISDSLAPVAAKILECRKAGAKKLATAAAKILERLGFKNADFEIELKASAEPSMDCGSSCEFKFSANAGQPRQPLAKIASSGELARVMLALKAVLAESDATPILVFDEVDANVGGEIGAEVGRELELLARGRQVFCVTHLPQVAARAKNHFLVEKTQTKNSTSVSISPIGDDRQRRVGELARMLGDRNSASARAHAEKLLDNSL